MVNDGIIQKELQKGTPTGIACGGKMILQFRERSHIKKISFPKGIGAQTNELEVIAVFFNRCEISLCRFLFQDGLRNNVDGSMFDVSNGFNQISHLFCVEPKVIDSKLVWFYIGVLDFRFLLNALSHFGGISLQFFSYL